MPLDDATVDDDVPPASTDFYRDLDAVADFAAVVDPRSFVKVPDDWHIFVTDVKGSTRAIADGRYRDINVLGASSIAAARNAANPIEIPYVFGGDGATILVPESKVDSVGGALAGVRAIATTAFDLELRVGLVPVATIREHGADVRVARLQLGESVKLAMFTGGGLAKADDLIKSHPNFEFKPTGSSPEPDLTGLHCRWAPIESNRGTVLTLIVVARTEDESERSQIYTDVLECIDKLTQSSPSPIDERLQIASGKGAFDAESRVQTQSSGGVKKVIYETQVRAKAAVFNTLRKSGRTLGSMNPTEYIRGVVQNTDFRKFDDCLRMVIDVSHDDARTLRAELEDKRAKGSIFFGIHLSDSALMTCVVYDLQEDHVHFVDGSDGGYTQAARELKAQIKAASPSAQ